MVTSLSGMKPYLRFSHFFLALDSHVSYSSYSLDKASDNQNNLKREETSYVTDLTERTSLKEIKFKAFQIQWHAKVFLTVSG